MAQTQAIEFYQEAKAIVPFLQSIEKELSQSGLGKLFHLIALRASQINQCGYCVNMHVEEALRDGETEQRLNRLVVWNRVSDFTDKEKAAFAWVDALTRMETETYASLRANLRAHFTETEIALLTAKVAMINLWNRIQVANY